MCQPCMTLRDDRFYIFQFKLLAVDALGKAIEPIVLSVENNLYEDTSRAIERCGFFILVRDTIVGIP